MARRLEFTRKASADIEGIWAYTSRRWGAEQAQRYVSTIRDRCRALAGGEFPATQVDVGGRLFLKLRAGSHVIFGLETEAMFLVVRILHVRQDPDTGFA
ncbi:type II toxin-antitoxin system RelE/ParE family toxin [Sphingosinicella sp. BN140058]|uniref:type II toxin-antitoxin system RelE/ParE family toxin n=1 Tax=Sphingosinicella sp. BN140058 TaxID=1892855 RepID=UPI0013ED7F6C|nr:type II toxin-antitoxin system RelE/ParE family toxin [Sphingosinicella sp. BN140058]